MDPSLLTTYTALLDSMQRRCKGDTASASDDEKALMAEYLTEAMKWAWEYPRRPWPNTVEGMTVTVSGGTFPWSAIYHANWFEVFRADPRPLPPFTPRPLPIPCRRDADGVWPLWNWTFVGTPSDTLFVLLQRRAPEFSMAVVQAATAYKAGDVVYDGATGKTGNCYRALVNVTTPTPPDAQLADATQWELMVVPRFMRDAVLQYARGGWLRDKTEEDKSEGYLFKAIQMLESEWFNQQEGG